jgi:hypothetical protein
MISNLYYFFKGNYHFIIIIAHLINLLILTKLVFHLQNRFLNFRVHSNLRDSFANSPTVIVIALILCSLQAPGFIKF